MYFSDTRMTLVLIINIPQLFLHSLFYQTTLAQEQKHFHNLILDREEMATGKFTHHSWRTLR